MQPYSYASPVYFSAERKGRRIGSPQSTPPVTGEVEQHSETEPR